MIDPMSLIVIGLLCTGTAIGGFVLGILAGSSTKSKVAETPDDDPRVRTEDLEDGYIPNRFHEQDGPAFEGQRVSKGMRRNRKY